MINDCVDPKVLCFLRDYIDNSETAVKSYLSARSFEKISKTEEMFPSNAQPNNPEIGNWITDSVDNQIIDQISKTMFLLKLHFSY